MCNKQVKRNLRNIFKVFSCENCSLIKKDEKILIGNNVIYIYYLGKCEYHIDDFLYNKKLIQILYEFIVGRVDEVLIIEEYKNIAKDDLEVLLEMKINIHIIN